MLGRVVMVLVCAVLAVAVRGRAQEVPAGEVGTISGVVLDKGTGEPVIDAGVEVVGQGKSARTDLDGRYSIKIKPGTYEVRIFAAEYQAVRIPAVTVAPGKVFTADATLAASGQAGVQVVEVIAEASKAAEATQLLRRKKAAVVKDTISAETIRKTPGGDAGDIVQRAPAVVVKDEKYINVRGLQERYTSALLNGSRLPSTDPQRRVVPLDLFPAGFLDSLSIVKSYTPDLPGDFSGGLAELELRDFPETLSYSFGTSTSANSQTTFKDFDTYRGGTNDYLGFGRSFREKPDSVPPDPATFKKLSDVQRARIGRQFRNNWDVETETAPPGFGISGSVGNSWGPFGVQLAGLYGNEYKHRDGEVANQFVNQAASLDAPPELLPRDALTYDRSQFVTKLGGILTSAYKLTDAHKLTFRGLVNHASNDTTLVGSGFRFNAPDLRIDQQNLRYTEELLGFGQLGSEHRWSWIHLDFRTALARTTQEEPDTRFFTQVQGQAVPDSLGGTRISNNLKETLTDSAADFTIPWKTALPYTDVWSDLPASFKFGAAYSYRNRDFDQRRFRYRLDSTGFFDLTLPPETLFQPANIGPGGYSFEEETAPRDRYSVSQEIIGGYGMFELPIVRDRLRFIGGVRYEYSYIQLDTFDDQGNPAKVIDNNSDPLAGGNLVYTPREDMNLRLAYGRSVSRPDFRELSPTVYLAPLGELQVQGNPFLIEAEIQSYDFRWEWFFSPLELLSFSVFHKQLTNPIEETIVPQSSNSLQTWQNAEDGEITGFEFEGRKDFGFLGSHWKNLTFLTNVTYAESEVNTPRRQLEGTTSIVTVNTSTKRALQGQAPFIANAALDYTHPRWGSVRLLYNTAGERIALVGSFGLPDIQEVRRDQLDFVASMPLKEWLDVPLTASFGVENILNDQVIWTLGQGIDRQNITSGAIFNQPGVRDGTQKRYTTGIKFTVGLSYNF